LPATDRVVLIVEDNADHALLLRMAVERLGEGLDVRVVRDGLEAIAYLKGEHAYADRVAHPFPELVLLDLIMPRLDGFGVLEWIQTSRELRSLPVVVLTSSISPADESRSRRLGARAFHTNPADLTELRSQVREILATWLG